MANLTLLALGSSALGPEFCNSWIVTIVAKGNGYTNMKNNDCDNSRSSGNSSSSSNSNSNGARRSNSNSASIAIVVEQ